MLLDLGDGRFGIFRRHAKTASQPWLRAQPLRKLPLIDRRANRRSQSLIEEASCDRIENAARDSVGIEQLLAHQAEIGTGRPTVRGPRIAAHAVAGGEARIGDGLYE